MPPLTGPISQEGDMFSKTVGNTPTHLSETKSVSSHNSNNSNQQFTGVM